MLLGLASTVDAQQPPRVDSNAPGWQRVPFPADAQSLSFVNPDTGWVVGDNGAFYTSDAGQHWQLRASGGFGQVHFFDANEGWLLNGRMLHTLNGGLSWDTTSPPFSNGPTGMLWLNSDTGFVFGFEEMARIVRQDTGWSWLSASCPEFATGGSVASMGFFDSGHVHGLALGGAHYVSQQYPNSPTIIRSDDGGKTWYRPEWAEGTGYFTDLLIIDSTRALGFHNNWRTTDRGSTWVLDTTLAAYTFTHVSFHDVKNGLGCGVVGLIAVTNDSGQTWTHETSGTLETIKDIQLLDSADAFAVGTNGLFLRTTNGGFSNVKQNTQFPLTIKLYPDPAQQSISFEYTLSQLQHVTFLIYSVNGTLVSTPVNAEAEASGSYSFSLNTASLASGNYSFVFSSENYYQTGQFQVIH